MNLSRPDDPSENSILRRATSKRRPGRIFTGELFAGYGVLVPDASASN
jgi:hypothetical protein